MTYSIDYESQLAADLNCSLSCAADILYLRTRSRWTQELEDELVAAHKRGEEINIFEFGSTRETQQELLDAALQNLDD